MGTTKSQEKQASLLFQTLSYFEITGTEANRVGTVGWT